MLRCLLKLAIIFERFSTVKYRKNMIIDSSFIMNSQVLVKFLVLCFPLTNFPKPKHFSLIRQHIAHFHSKIQISKVLKKFLNYASDTCMNRNLRKTSERELYYNESLFYELRWRLLFSKREAR